MLLFRSEEEIQNWCNLHQKPRGEILSLSQVWELSKVWYSNRMSPDFRGRTKEQVAHIFESLGLSSTFWKVG